MSRGFNGRFGPTFWPAFQGRRTCTAGSRSECPISLLRWPRWPATGYCRNRTHLGSTYLKTSLTGMRSVARILPTLGRPKSSGPAWLYIAANDGKWDGIRSGSVGARLCLMAAHIGAEMPESGAIHIIRFRGETGKADIQRGLAGMTATYDLIIMISEQVRYGRILN